LPSVALPHCCPVEPCLWLCTQPHCCLGLATVDYCSLAQAKAKGEARENKGAKKQQKARGKIKGKQGCVKASSQYHATGGGLQQG